MQISNFNHRKGGFSYSVFIGDATELALSKTQEIGLDSFFFIDDIDIFAYANIEDSYTATRSVASYLKGISSALKKPLMAIDADETNTISSDLVAKRAIQKFKESGMKSDLFDSKNANPTYAVETKYKKINE